MKRRHFIMVIILGAFFLNGKAQNIYTLKNHNIEFSIDDKGNMLTLKNLQTGFNYASGKPVWRLYFDRKNEKDIEVFAKDNLPTIRQTGNQIIVTYNKLKAREENLDFKLSFKIILEENMLRFCSEIANNELHTIVRELQYPLVSNCKVFPDNQLLTTESGGRLYPDAKKTILSSHYGYNSPDQYFIQKSVRYSRQVSANCFALVGKSQGLYFGSHDTTFQDTWHGLRLYPDNNHEFNELELGLYKYPNCLSGKSWKNDANVIAPYSGDWHQTAKIYRSWVDTWWEKREEPQWVKEMKGAILNIFKTQYGETLYTYEDLPTRIKKAGQSVGVNVALAFGWWDIGFDNMYPDGCFVTDPDQGGDKAWKKAISDYQRDGGKVMLYYQGKLIDRESDYYKKGDGKKVSLKNNIGAEYIETYAFPGSGTFTGYYNTRTFVTADMKDPKWHKKLIEMADHAISMGANGIFYDQLGFGENEGNWDLSNEFPIPEMHVIKDKANALKIMNDYLYKKDKDLSIGTEHISDVTSQYVDYIHGILDVGSTKFIEWFRYTFPEVIILDRNYDGDDRIRWTNQTVLLGLRSNVQKYTLRGLIDETPRLQKHLAEINQLKGKYSSLLLLGTFRDNEGFTIDNEIIDAKSFTNGNQMAIVLTQSSYDKALAHLSVPGYQYKEASGVGDTEIIVGTNGIPTIIIGRDGLVVSIYEKKY